MFVARDTGNVFWFVFGFLCLRSSVCSSYVFGLRFVVLMSSVFGLWFLCVRSSVCSSYVFGLRFVVLMSSVFGL